MAVRANPIRIRLAETDEDRGRALSFLSEIVRQRYDCEPLSLPEVVIVAEDEDRIVGTVGIAFCEDDGVFPLEKVYALDYENLPFPLSRSSFAEFGRWAASRPNISGALLYASAVYALGRGKTHGLGEAKGRVAERFGELGLKLHFLNAPIIMENVPERSKNYYVIPPLPLVSMFDLNEEEAALRPAVAGAVREGRIILDVLRQMF